MARSSNISILVLAVALSALALSACTRAEGSVLDDTPITIEEIPGSAIQRLALSELAAERLDVQTSPVKSSGDGMVVPSAAVIIDERGLYWVYTSPEPLVYVRHEIRPVHEEGMQAFFEDGPPPGSLVVTTGVPELYGAEFGIGK